MNMENDKLYKNIMEQIEDEWCVWKQHLLDVGDLCELDCELDDFKMENGNCDYSYEQFNIEFENMEQLMIYQKWCSYKMEDYGMEDMAEQQKVLFDMTTLKMQVLYWVMSDFEGLPDDWEEKEDEDEEDEDEDEEIERDAKIIMLNKCRLEENQQEICKTSNGEDGNTEMTVENECVSTKLNENYEKCKLCKGFYNKLDKNEWIELYEIGVEECIKCGATSDMSVNKRTGCCFCLHECMDDDDEE